MQHWGPGLTCGHLQAETYTAEAAETLELPDSEEAQAKDNPFSKLEQRVEDWKRGIAGADRLAELLEDSEAKMKDDYTINKALRRQLRYGTCLIAVVHIEMLSWVKGLTCVSCLSV